MRNYNRPQSHQTSREYYINELKNVNNNLNSSKNSNTMDTYIDNWLSISYKYVAPFFEDENFKKNYTKEVNANKIDEDFDNSLPNWMPSLLGFFTKIVLFFFPKKITSKIKKITKSILIKVKKALTLFMQKSFIRKPSNPFKKSINDNILNNLWI